MPLSPLLLIKFAGSSSGDLRNYYPERGGGAPSTEGDSTTRALVDKLWDYHSRTVSPSNVEESGESMPGAPPTGGVQA